MSSVLEGIGVSCGVASGTVILVLPSITIERRLIEKNESEAQINRFKASIDQYVQNTQIVIEQSRRQVSGQETAILEAHLLIARDPALLQAVVQKIETEQKCASWAAAEVMDSYIAMFENLSDEYLRQRVADITEVRKTVLELLSGQQSEIRTLTHNSIIIADDLGPAETLSLDRTRIAAFVTEKGGRTSHTSILARALGIPAVVGVAGIVGVSETGMSVIVDADKGRVIINPTEDQQTQYAQKIQIAVAEQALLKEGAHQPGVTTDGKKIGIWANIGSDDEVKVALANGAEGIGLFRTEFLYMDRTELPSEQEQEDIYRQVLTAMQGKPVVIRTLDLGADKQLSYMRLKAEENPALGCRAIRLCLKEKELFKRQVRALLKASVCGNLWIMFPMIATLEELHDAQAIVREAREELSLAGAPIALDIKIGMMVEVPAAAINADFFAQEVDFFSIGSNDLVQYVFAADRQNQNVDYLYQPANPAVLRLINNAVRAAHAAGIPVGMCGEMAGDIMYADLLVGLGLDELSMASGSILRMKKAVRFIHSQTASEKVCSIISDSKK